MKRKVLNITLSITTATLLFTGCAGGDSPTFDISKLAEKSFNVVNNSETGRKNMNELKKEVQEDYYNFENVSEENKILLKMQPKLAKNSPDMKSVEKYVGKDDESQYYYNLINNFLYAEISAKIESKRISKKEAVDSVLNTMDIPMGMTKEQMRPMIENSPEVAKMTSKTTESKVLKQLPKGASFGKINKAGNTSTIVITGKEKNDIKVKTKMNGESGPSILIAYEVNTKDEAYNKLWELSDKLHQFLSKDENWGYTNEETLHAASRHRLSDPKLMKQHEEIVFGLKEDIKKDMEDGKPEFMIASKRKTLKKQEESMSKEILNKKYMKGNFKYYWESKHVMKPLGMEIKLGAQKVGSKYQVSFLMDKVVKEINFK